MELLLDPGSCGEDLPAIAARSFELAPLLCDGCSSYHMRATARRASGARRSLELDRHLIIEELREVLAEFRQSGRDALNISILGSADTGQLATCAHAVARHAPDMLPKARFLVSDLCQTPLALCAEYADHHGLALTTCRMDLQEALPPGKADIILMHSILRFIPEDLRVQFLSRLTSHLKPHGRIIFSNRCGPDRGDVAGGAQRSARSLERILAMVRSGQIKTELNEQKLRERLTHNFQNPEERDVAIHSLGQAKQLFSDSGLHVLRASAPEFLVKDEGGTGQVARVLAVLSAPDGF